MLPQTGPCFAGAKLGASNMVICLWLTPFIYDLLTTAMLVFRVSGPARFVSDPSAGS